MAKILTTKDWQNAVIATTGYVIAQLLLAQYFQDGRRIDPLMIGVFFWVYLGLTRWAKKRFIKRVRRAVNERFVEILEAYIGEPANEETCKRVYWDALHAIQPFFPDNDLEDSIEVTLFNGYNPVITFYPPIEGMEPTRVTFTRREA